MFLNPKFTRLPGSARAKGVSLIEVLVAVVIFVFGLMGLLAGAARAIRTNHDAYVGSQAVSAVGTFLSMVRRNQGSLFAGEYNGTAIAVAAPTTSNCRANFCTGAQLAVDDFNLLGGLLGRSLPVGATLASACTPHIENAAVANLVQVNYLPVYSGVCEITVRWVSDKSGNLTTRVWRVKP